MRLYESVRAVHLERAGSLPPASILYRLESFDVETPPVESELLVRAGPLRAALLLLRSPVETLEINEPLMLSSLPSTSLALLALELRRIAGRPRTTVVTYAIANADPFVPPQNTRTRIRRRLERAVASVVLRRVDRAAFGTGASRETYESLLAEVDLTSSSVVVPALPAPAPGAASSDRVEGRVVYVGALSEGKGIRILLQAWPDVVTRRPEASLAILGRGLLETDVLAAARLVPGITVEIDPDGRRITSALDEAKVLVLPLQPAPARPEQIGRPIVDGLSHGLSVVTTGQTGLAEWLREHDHAVVSDPTSSSELATAIVHLLDSGRSVTDVLGTLPERDGRLVADDWMFSHRPAHADGAKAHR